MVDHAIRGAIRGQAQLTYEDHDVIGIFLNPRLVEEKQISRPSLPAITTYENRIKGLESAGIGKFRESSVREIICFVMTKGSAEKFIAQQARLFVVRNVWCYCLITRTHLLKPKSIVASQRLAPGKSHQT